MVAQNKKTPAIQLEEISRIYQMAAGEVAALARINLTVEQGKYLAVMGHSGSGKTTLLNLLGCLDQPSSGRYYLGGEDVSALPDDRLSEIRNRKIGFIFQSYNLDSTTGQEILSVLHEMHRQGKTLVVITHDVSVAQHSSRTIQIVDGHIKEQN